MPITCAMCGFRVEVACITVKDSIRCRAKHIPLLNGPKRSAIVRAQFIDAPEDTEVQALCERVGYGAVMDAAARLWARKDSRGALYVAGDCLGVDDLESEAREIRSQALKDLADMGQEFEQE